MRLLFCTLLVRARGADALTVLSLLLVGGQVAGSGHWVFDLRLKLKSCKVIVVLAEVTVRVSAQTLSLAVVFAILGNVKASPRVLFSLWVVNVEEPAATG